MRLAQRVSNIQPSPTLAISAKAQQLRAAGEPVLPMAAGEPDFETPESIRTACVHALAEGNTRYTSPAGIIELRRAISDRYQKELGLTFGVDDQIMVSCGAKQCLYNAMQTLLDPGDQVIIQVPYWVSYPAQVTLAGGQSVFLPIDKGTFGFNRQALSEVSGARLRMILLNSPSNPSGAVLSKEDLDAVAEAARNHDLIILTDDIYDKLVFDGKRPVHILERHPDLQDRTVIVNGVSKAYAMTGWRVGYALGPAEIIAGMRKVQGQSTTNTATFSQAGAVAALGCPDQVVDAMVAAFSARRKRIVELLNRLPGVSCQLPAGAFYAFPDVSALVGKTLDDRVIDSSLVLTECLLDQEKVAAVPGEAFGAPGYIRFSYACSEETIQEAIRRFEYLISRLK
jgi:aspartate aminotransferase